MEPTITENYIVQKLYSSISSSGESCKIELVTSLKSGKSKFQITKSFSEEFAATKENFKKVKKLYEKLTGGGGRTAYSLEDLTK